MKNSNAWYNLQQKNQGWKEIEPDYELTQFLSSKSWSLNLKFCHANLKEKLSQFNVEKTEKDFFVITDIEISKLPLSYLFKLIKKNYDTHKIGGYIACLSYYLNVQKTYDISDQLTYSQSIKKIFEQELSFANLLEDKSCVNDNPINLVKEDSLVEGSNFIFVHPNIRYFIWK